MEEISKPSNPFKEASTINPKICDDDDSDDYTMDYGKIDDKAILNGMIEIKKKDCRKITENIYITICIITIFISLLSFNKYHLLSTILITLCLLLLHFKEYTLSFIYKSMDIYDYSSSSSSSSCFSSPSSYRKQQ